MVCCLLIVGAGCTPSQNARSGDDFHVMSSGGWCWFNETRAVRYVGNYDRTYWSWIDQDGNVMIGSYDHGSRQSCIFNLHAVIGVDDHNVAGIGILSDGKVLATYSAHAASTIYCRVSTLPENIESWSNEITILTDPDRSISYPKPVQLSGESNKIYVFFRDGPKADPGRYQSYVTSADGGYTWSARQGLMDAGAGNRAYVLLAADGTDTIYFCSSGHPAEEAKTSVYAFYYHDSRVYRADGTEIGVSPGDLLISRADMDVVYDATREGHYAAWIWDIALVGETPYVVFATFASTTDHRYNYAKWSGSAWDEHEITTGGGSMEESGSQLYYSGGISLNHEAPDVVYFSKPVSSVFEILKGVTNDGGDSWDFSSITSGSTHNNTRPTAILNGRAEMPLLWMHGSYSAYTDFDTLIVTEAVR